MNKIVTTSWIIPAILGVAGFSGVLRADAPVVNITGPTSPLVWSGSSFTTSIAFTITHSELKNLNVLDVLVGGTSIFSGGQPIGNPFDNANACGSLMVLPNVSSCSTTPTDAASVQVPWTITEPGDYVIMVSVKHQGVTGADEEAVSVVLATVAHPAPPSVANKYINSKYGAKAAAKVRGCVLNQIAGNHAKDRKYGDSPGPYNEALIGSDVDSYWLPCATQ
jgi:hypothetical protein